MTALPEVVVATVDGEPDSVAVGWNSETWDTAVSTALDGGAITDRRPLLLIDPEDREQVERLTGALVHAGSGRNDTNHWREVQTALRSLVQPPTPEPTGLGAVVVSDDKPFTRMARQGETPWIGEGGLRFSWAQVVHIGPVEEKSAGWSE